MGTFINSNKIELILLLLQGCMPGCGTLFHLVVFVYNQHTVFVVNIRVGRFLSF